MATRGGVRLFLYRAVELVGLLAVIVVLAAVGVPVWIPLLVIVVWIAAPRFVRRLRRTWDEAGWDEAPRDAAAQEAAADRPSRRRRSQRRIGPATA